MLKNTETTMTIQSSFLLQQEIHRILAGGEQNIAEIPSGSFFPGPSGGFEKKSVFLPKESNVEDRNKICLAFARFLEKEKIDLRIWLEIKEEGALITDTPSPATNKLRR
jgi:hypothetical protein